MTFNGNILTEHQAKARCPANFMGESGFYDTVIISLFYQKTVNMPYTSALPHEFWILQVTGRAYKNCIFAFLMREDIPA